MPLGILGAIYLNEYGGKNWLAALIGFFSDVMTGVPSIIMGLFIFSIWVLHFGFSGLAGALALGCLMLPIVIRSTYEMLRLVPNSLREGSYALGATKARVTVTVVLPAAIGGIVSGAPARRRPGRGRDGAAAVHASAPRLAANRMCSAAPNRAALADLRERVIIRIPARQARGWGAALTLIAICFILMIVARLVTARFTRCSR